MDKKIALVDDHTIMRSALGGFLNGASGYVVHFEAGSKEELLAKLQWEQKPEVILMDYGLGKDVGSDCISEVRKTYGEDIGIIGLSMHQDPLIIQEMITAGANGYLFKGTDTKEMLVAIDNVIDHGFYINKFTRSMVFGRSTGEDSNNSIKLNEVECNIIRLICEEKGNDVIAETLELSPNTVHTYRKRILKKAQCKNTAGLVVFAIRHKIFEIS